MAEQYLVSSSDLASVADAIRSKTGGTDQLSFPEGFNTAISSISAPPSTPYVEEFYDENNAIISANVVGTTKIRPYLFYNCDTIRNVTFSSAITDIGDHAFYNCQNLEFSKLPDTVTSIGDYAFATCKKVTLSTFPKNLTTIKFYAFSECEGIIGDVIIPDTVETIGYNVFFCCTGIESVVLSANLKNLANRVFTSCESLKTVTFKTTPIETSDADFKWFNNCPALTTINVPWAEGAVSGAPWGATNATINYNYAAAE